MNTKRDTKLPASGVLPGAASSRSAPRAAPRPDVSPAVYRRLRELIVTGRLGPGATLIEADLAKRLGASRTPVRAALRRLQQEGFVAASPVGQTLRPIVGPLTAGDLAEVFEMAGAFEAAAVRAAATVNPAHRERLAARLNEVAADLEAASSSRPPDLASLHALEAQFHRALVDAAGPRLRAELDVLFPQAERYSRAYGAVALQSPADAVHERRAVVNALQAGDAERAAQGAAAHWRRSLERLRPVIAALGEQGTW